VTSPTASLPAAPFDFERARYLAKPVPIVFPEEAVVPETQLAFELRVLLYQLLRDHLVEHCTIGSDQFVYWLADDPTAALAPDICVRRGSTPGLIRTWKTWERGAPEVAVEIVSDSDATPAAWAIKLASYRRLGVLELLRFDPDADPGEALRVWYRQQGDLIERALDTQGVAPSAVLPITWAVAPADELPIALRIRAGGVDAPLVPTHAETRRLDAEARRLETERAEAEARRAHDEATARRAAEARIAELEAELARRDREPG
jgi:Uma2 family endonuclease